MPNLLGKEGLSLLFPEMLYSHIIPRLQHR